jgi:hypothetical protein
MTTNLFQTSVRCIIGAFLALCVSHFAWAADPTPGASWPAPKLPEHTPPNISTLQLQKVFTALQKQGTETQLNQQFGAALNLVKGNETVTVRQLQIQSREGSTACGFLQLPNDQGFVLTKKTPLLIFAIWIDKNFVIMRGAQRLPTSNISIMGERFAPPRLAEVLKDWADISNVLKP